MAKHWFKVLVKLWLVSVCFYICSVRNVFGEAQDSIGQEKMMFNVVLILFQQHCLGQNLMQCCPKGSRQHCIRQKPVKYCLNSLETILHRSKPYAMLSEEDPDSIALEKKPAQCCLNTLRTTLYKSKPYTILFDRLQTTSHNKKSGAILS